MTVFVFPQELNHNDDFYILQLVLFRRAGHFFFKKPLSAKRFHKCKSNLFREQAVRIRQPLTQVDYTFPSTSKLFLHSQFHTFISTFYSQGQPVAIEMADLNAVELARSLWLPEHTPSEWSDGFLPPVNYSLKN